MLPTFQEKTINSANYNSLVNQTNPTSQSGREKEMGAVGSSPLAWGPRQGVGGRCVWGRSVLTLGPWEPSRYLGRV